MVLLENSRFALSLEDDGDSPEDHGVVSITASPVSFKTKKNIG